MHQIDNGPITTEIARRLVSRFAPASLNVIDESASHRGHGNHIEGVQTHVAVRITAAAFAGLSRVAAVRLVQAEVRDLLDPPVGNGPVHAFSVTATAG
jgi:BolA family transcriptional regulator, general stress-responsive regulator